MQEVILKDFLKVSTNDIYGSKNWNYRKKIKNDYLKWFASCYKNSFMHVNKPVDIEFEYYWKSHLLDCDNCSFSAKMIVDCLIHYNIIKNDTPEYVRSVKYSSYKSNTGENYCLLRII